jgi:chromosome segregation ATPase
MSTTGENTPIQTNADILQELDDWHQDYMKIHQRIQEKIQDLRNTIKSQNDTIQTLRQQLHDHEDQEDLKTKYTQLQEHFEKDKVRLEKLYTKYEETEKECQQLREDISNWHNWYDQHNDTFEKILTTAPQHTILPEVPKNETQPEHYHEPEKSPQNKTDTPPQSHQTKPQQLKESTEEDTKPKSKRLSTRRRIRIRR